MDFRTLDNSHKEEVASLFNSAFLSSEGEREARLVGSLASSLAARIDHREIMGMGAFEDGAMIGAIFFYPAPI